MVVKYRDYGLLLGGITQVSGRVESMLNEVLLDFSSKEKEVTVLSKLVGSAQYAVTLAFGLSADRCRSKLIRGDLFRVGFFQAAPVSLGCAANPGGPRLGSDFLYPSELGHLGLEHLGARSST